MTITSQRRDLAGAQSVTSRQRSCWPRTLTQFLVILMAEFEDRYWICSLASSFFTSTLKLWETPTQPNLDLVSVYQRWAINEPGATDQPITTSHGYTTCRSGCCDGEAQMSNPEGDLGARKVCVCWSHCRLTAR